MAVNAIDKLQFLSFISCKNFVNIGPVTPEKTELICILFLGQGKKLAYLVKYLRIYWTDFYKLHHMKAR